MTSTLTICKECKSCFQPTLNPREQFALSFMNKNIEDNDFPKCEIFTDEATLTGGGVFNTHNLDMWQNKNSHVQAGRYCLNF